MRDHFSLFPLFSVGLDQLGDIWRWMWMAADNTSPGHVPQLFAGVRWEPDHRNTLASFSSRCLNAEGIHRTQWHDDVDHCRPAERFGHLLMLTFAPCLRCCRVSAVSSVTQSHHTSQVYLPSLLLSRVVVLLFIFLEIVPA